MSAHRIKGRGALDLRSYFDGAQYRRPILHFHKDHFLDWAGLLAHRRRAWNSVADIHTRHKPNIATVVRYVQSQKVDVTGEPSARENMEKITNAASKTNMKAPMAAQKLFLCQLHRFLISIGS